MLQHNKNLNHNNKDILQHTQKNKAKVHHSKELSKSQEIFQRDQT